MTGEPAPHPAAAPAVAALRRLLDAADDDRDRRTLRAALDAVRAAYGPQQPRPARPRPEHGMAGDFGAHDDPTFDRGRPDA